jgi:hypothetical protein
MVRVLGNTRANYTAQPAACKLEAPRLWRRSGAGALFCDAFLLLARRAFLGDTHAKDAHENR